MLRAMSQFRGIDLFSDTVTRPTDAMRAVMASAEVGDEQLLEDPTVNELQQRTAKLLGKQAALFLPTGTMCNLIAFCVHCEPGDEVLLEAGAHPLHHEVGGAGVVAGVQLTPIEGVRGMFTVEQLRGAIRSPMRHHPRTRMVSIEQPTNAGGGAVWPVDLVGDVCDVAHAAGIVTHMDGARLFNAVVASGTSAAEFAAPFDSAWIDLSKGLGAPVGAVLAGSHEFVEQAWTWKQRLGGAMRQAGIVAAGGMYALEHHVERLAEDHANARHLAEGVAKLPGVGIDLDAVETNIVIFDIAGLGCEADEFLHELQSQHDVRLSPMGSTLVRAVTHLDVTRDDVDAALAAIAAVAGAKRAVARS
jgi:threonine aldolase